jgi:hypothetical protein
MTDAKINDFITKYVLKKDSLNRVLVSKRGLKTMVEAYNDIYKDKTPKERTVALSQLTTENLNENQKKNLSVIEALTRGGNFATLVEGGFLESMGFEKQVPKIMAKGMLETELPIKTVDYFIETPKKFMESMPDMARTGIEVEPDGGMKTPPMEEEEKEAEKPTPKLRGAKSKPTDFDKQFDKEFDEQLQKELEAREKAKAESKPAEKAKAESKPAEKPKPPTDTYPTKEKKQPKKVDDPPKTDTITEPLTPREGDRDAPTMADSVLEPEPVPQPIKLTTNKKKDSKVVETEVKTGLEDIPSKIDLIPPERLK